MKKTEYFPLSFLTWNLYMGAELTPLETSSLDQIPKRVTEVYRQFLATDFPSRVKEIAQEIFSKKPDLIGLQEAVRWQLVKPNFRIDTFDFVQMLRTELNKRGLYYEVASQNRNLFAELPDSQGNLVRLLDRDVILIQKERGLKVLTSEKANFKNKLTLHVLGHSIEVLRGWSSADIRLGRQVFRVINTHLEEAFSSVQVQQAKEILEGPANTDLPVIIMGDLNSSTSEKRISTSGVFTTAGFQDVWGVVGNGPGFTCCQAPNLLNAVSSLNNRIDFILYKNGWKPIEADLLGEKWHDRTPSGLWASDHAGVSARLVLQAR